MSKQTKSRLKEIMTMMNALIFACNACSEKYSEEKEESQGKKEESKAACIAEDMKISLE